MKRLAIPAVALAVIFACAPLAVLPIGDPSANATGKSINLTAYCNAKYNPGGRGIPWKAKYHRDRQQWWCEQETRVGPQTRGGGRKLIVPAQACLRMHDTLMIHTHTDLDPAIERNMHCGVHSGTKPPVAQMMRPATLKVCNQTSEGGISFGYALKYAARPSDSGWHAVGYWQLERGECKDLALPQNRDKTGYRGKVLLFGASRQRLFAGDATPICTRWGRSFTRHDADNAETCPAKGFSMMQTSQLIVKGGKNRYVFTD